VDKIFKLFGVNLPQAPPQPEPGVNQKPQNNDEPMIEDVPNSNFASELPDEKAKDSNQSQEVLTFDFLLHLLNLISDALPPA
jgi:hypothetical protein